MFKLKSVQAEPVRNAIVISDLDAMVAEKIAFRLHGQTHYIDPISTLTYLKFVNALDKFFESMKSKESSAEEVIDTCTALMSTVCSSITRKDIETCEQSQLSALFNLVYDSVGGKTQGKKKPLNPVNFKE